jgi:putative transposase
MARRRALAHPVPTGQTNLPIKLHGEYTPALPAAGKGQSGRLLRRPQRAYPAATVADFCTAVSTGGANDIWAMDFVSDKPFDGRSFRILTVVDVHTREALSIASRTNFRAYQVIEELDRLARLRGKPRSIRVDNGPEFAGRLLDQWAYLNNIELDFSRPGKPSANAYVEAFNSRLRQECLNASWFLSMADARARIEEWRDDYNHARPHSSLGGLTPAAFADQLKPARKVA